MKTRTPVAAEPLHPDPETAAELEFEPVPRQTRRPDGWTVDRQREFIRRLATCGSPRLACEAMGKNVSGVASIYKRADAASFRAAWDQAVLVGLEAQAAPRADPHFAHAPGMAARQPHNRPRDERGRHWTRPEPEPEIGEDHKIELLEGIASKFMRKVMHERQARLSGQIVAADFYLRQITALECAFDLSSSELGFDAREILRSLRRGEHGLIDIVDTPFVQYLDAQRRAYWESDPSQPPRPKTVREEFCLDHGDHRTHVDQHAFGATTTPARGYSEEQWAAMGFEAQVRAREAQFAEDAEEQIRWERSAQETWEASEHGAGAAADAAARREANGDESGCH